MEQYICNKKQAAQFFKVSVQALDGWFLRGCPVHKRHETDRIELLNLSDMAEWKIKQSSESDELGIEKTRLTKAQADKTELEVEVMRGTLAPVALVEKVWSGLCAVAKNKMLAIPYKIAFIAQGGSDFKAIEAAAKEIINEVLESIDALKAEDYATSPDVDTEPPELPAKNSAKPNPTRKKNKAG
mgnify:CR=1 FL=1